MPRLGAISYDGLPISSGGAHRLRTRGLIAGLRALETFVNAASLETSPHNLAVEIVEGEGVPRSLVSELTASFNALCAPTRSREIGGYVGHQWSFKEADLWPLIKTLEDRRPIPEAGYAGYAVVVHATWNIVLFDPNTMQALPNQKEDDYLGFDTAFQCYLGRSSLYSRISEKTTTNLFLTIPFEDVCEDAQRVAVNLQKNFPVRMSSKHWKLWRLTKAGNSYVGRKIAALV